MRCRHADCADECGDRMRTTALGRSVELPMGPRNAALGGGERMRCRHADCADECGDRIRTAALGPSVELPMGPRKVWGVPKWAP